MARLLSILKVVGQYRSVLLPAIVAFVGAVAAILGRRIDIGRVQALVDATSTLATIGAAIVGAAMDANNKVVKTAINDNAVAINENARQLDLVTPKETVAARVEQGPTCPRCGAQNPSTAVYCSRCGLELKPLADPKKEMK